MDKKHRRNLIKQDLDSKTVLDGVMGDTPCFSPQMEEMKKKANKRSRRKPVAKKRKKICRFCKRDITEVGYCLCGVD